MFLEKAEYSKIIAVFPRACVDILIIAPTGRILLLKRVNEPASGEWWFPGGRILLGETRMETAQRKIREECGLEFTSAKELGTFDLFFTAGDKFFHDATLLLQMNSNAETAIQLDAEASAFGWFHPEECQQLSLHSYVLQNMQKAYRDAMRRRLASA